MSQGDIGVTDIGCDILPSLETVLTTDTPLFTPRTCS